MKRIKNFTLGILGVTFLSLGLFSCSNDDGATTDKQQNNESLIKTNALPLWPFVVIKIISESVDGKYYLEIEYNSDGSIRSEKEGCRGFLGTCKMPSRLKSSSESVSLDSSPLDYIESGSSRLINAELLKTHFGILYAINKKEYSDDCEFFFNTDKKEISGELIIDNPKVLKELEVTKPIIIHGEYKVYENEDYKYIIIDEQ